MEPTPTVLDEASTIDTWNQGRDSETLQSFVSRRLADEALASVELAVSV
jgi:hypothetical protein